MTRLAWVCALGLAGTLVGAMPAAAAVTEPLPAAPRTPAATASAQPTDPAAIAPDPAWAAALAAALGADGGPQVGAVLAQQPAWRAALHSLRAEQAVARQWRAGSGEWVAALSAARRRQTDPAVERSQEWELSVERALRLPGKAKLHAAAGLARVQQAQAQAQRVWRELARQLVQDLASAQRETRAAALWQAQAALLAEQRDAVVKRQRLGDAAQIEAQQAELAWLQAQAQADAARNRAATARAFLTTRYPGLAWRDTPAPAAGAAGPALSPSPAPTLTDDALLQRLQEASAELAAARHDAAAAQAQARVDAAEVRGDPSVGLRWGQARSGAEQYVGVMLSLPLGSDYRRAGADAAQARASAAALQAADAQARWQADAARRLAELRAADAALHRAQRAAQQADAVAERLRLGYRLGEGSLTDVLNARRQANELHQAALAAALDRLQQQALLAIDARWLWPEPADPGVAGED